MKKAFLPYIHPLFQILVLLTGLKTLLSGLKIKSERRYQATSKRRLQLRKLHVKWGIFFILLYLIGFSAGIISMILIRDKNPFRTPHAYFSAFCLCLFLTGTLIGLKIRKTDNPSTDDLQLHALFTISGFILSLLNVILGYGLLP